MRQRPLILRVFYLMIGIYKITSPSNKIYIGQSINIENRFKRYKYKSCREQRRLYYSLLKYGSENHLFEVIEECSIELLNERERYWQDYYNVLDLYLGLNCVLTNTNDKKGYLSDETKKKIGSFKMTDEMKKKISKTHKGKIKTEEHRKRISEGNKGKKMSFESKEKMSLAKKGKIGSKHFYENCHMSNLGKKFSKEHKRKISASNKNAKIVIDLNTGVFYNSCAELSRLYNFKHSTIKGKLNGSSKNNTQFKYI